MPSSSWHVSSGGRNRMLPRCQGRGRPFSSAQKTSVSSGNQQKPIRPVGEVQLFFSKAAPMAFDGLGIYILQFFRPRIAKCKSEIEVRHPQIASDKGLDRRDNFA